MLILCLFLFSASPVTESLELKQAYFVETSLGERFDLSGMLFLTKTLKDAYALEAFDLLLVSDQSSWVYRARFDNAELVRAEPWYRIGLNWGVRHDFEDIDASGDRIFVLNEGDGTIIEIQPDQRPVLHKLNKLKPPYEFSDWFGAEALAVKGSEFWVFREMPPLAAIRKVKSRQKLISKEGGGSQTAARFHRDKLYILDRDERCVWRSQYYAGEESCLSFKKWVDADSSFRYQVRDSEGKLHPEWSTAEALEIFNSSLWIGLDNNGQPLYRDLKEKRPSILQFQLP